MAHIDDRSIGEIIAKLTGKQPETILGHVSLGSLGISQSLRLSVVRSSLQNKFGIDLPYFSTDTTVAQLAKLANKGGSTIASSDAVSGSVSSSPKTQSRRLGELGSQKPPVAMGVGLDLQDIETLPMVIDYRVDPFYSAHFSPAELATAVLRANPQAHLCGVFCLKEAAKKSHPALLHVQMTSFLVTHEVDGQPNLQLLDESIAQRYTFAISITHSGRYAAATCLTMVTAS